MEITTNAIGNILGPLLWILFLTTVAWYAVRGSLAERREVAPVRDRGDSTAAPSAAASRRPRLGHRARAGHVVPTRARKSAGGRHGLPTADSPPRRRSASP